GGRMVQRVEQQPRRAIALARAGWPQRYFSDCWNLDPRLRTRLGSRHSGFWINCDLRRAPDSPSTDCDVRFLHREHADVVLSGGLGAVASSRGIRDLSVASAIQIGAHPLRNRCDLRAFLRPKNSDLL